MKKMKKLFVTMSAITATTMLSLTAFAGEWKMGVSKNAWWYDNGDGTYATKGWHWIDGNNDGTAECYYFDSDGWMLSNTVTPDGWYVNSDGAWVVNGITQTKPVEVKAGTGTGPMGTTGTTGNVSFGRSSGGSGGSSGGSSGGGGGSSSRSSGGGSSSGGSSGGSSSKSTRDDDSEDKATSSNVSGDWMEQYAGDYHLTKKQQGKADRKIIGDEFATFEFDDGDLLYVWGDVRGTSEGRIEKENLVKEGKYVHDMGTDVYTFEFYDGNKLKWTHENKIGSGFKDYSIYTKD